MKKIITGIVVVLFLSNTNIFAQNDPDSTDEKGSFGVTVNPAFYALGGYSIKGFYHLPKKWSFGIAAEAGFELPDAFRDSFFKDNEAVNVDWDYLVGVEARYRFNDAHYDKGFYALTTLGYEGWTVNEVGTDEDTSFDNWYTSVGIGYNWYPFKKKNFNVGLSYNIIFILNNTDDQVVGNTSFAIDTVIPPSLIPSTISLGWRF